MSNEKKQNLILTILTIFMVATFGVGIALSPKVDSIKKEDRMALMLLDKIANWYKNDVGNPLIYNYNYSVTNNTLYIQDKKTLKETNFVLE